MSNLVFIQHQLGKTFERYLWTILLRKQTFNLGTVIDILKIFSNMAVRYLKKVLIKDSKYLSSIPCIYEVIKWWNL